MEGVERGRADVYDGGFECRGVLLVLAASTGCRRNGCSAVHRGVAFFCFGDVLGSAGGLRRRAPGNGRAHM